MTLILEIFAIMVFIISPIAAYACITIASREDKTREHTVEEERFKMLNQMTDCGNNAKAVVSE